MYALLRVFQVTGDGTYAKWAVELAHIAHARFVYSPPSGKSKRMHWKMSTDLSYPLVQSMGLHDPIDGMITYMQLAATQARAGEGLSELAAETADMAEMCRGRSWITEDALGIGSLLTDALRVGRLTVSGIAVDPALLPSLLDASAASLELLDLAEELMRPPDYRLPFRELGLSIGLRAVPVLGRLMAAHPVRFDRDVGDLMRRFEGLGAYDNGAKMIEDYWIDPACRGQTWSDHRDINVVMLATSLSPIGYLGS
jgi:hypothetical protein